MKGLVIWISDAAAARASECWPKSVGPTRGAAVKDRIARGAAPRLKSEPAQDGDWRRPQERCLRDVDHAVLLVRHR